MKKRAPPQLPYPVRRLRLVREEEEESEEEVSEGRRKRKAQSSAAVKTAFAVFWSC